MSNGNIKTELASTTIDRDFLSFRHSDSGVSSITGGGGAGRVEDEEYHEGDPVPVQDDILSEVQPEVWFQQSLLVIVVGASGDLAKKKTYPALYALYQAGLLPQETVIWGFARSPKTHEGFREHIQALLEDSEAKDSFLSRCFYRNGTAYGDWECLESILKDAADYQNTLVYLAVPPHVFSETTGAVRRARQNLLPDTSNNNNSDKGGWFRVVLEKPFGRDLKSCEELLSALEEQQWPEKDLYRIDHYLGKEMVQNIVSMRQHNPWMQAIWNKSSVQSVHILFKEPFGTEGRGGYFDSIGIIRDILQNHLLQVLTLIAMELPATWTGTAIRDAKAKVIDAMSILQVKDCLLGQYDGYKHDSTIQDKETVCPTYAAIRCRVNTPLWQDVPFVLEAGKALDELLCEVRLHLRGTPGSPPNALVVRLQPTPAAYFVTNVKMPGFSSTPVSTHWGVTYEAHQHKIPEAYSRLLLDVMRGHQEHFVRDDELRRAWQVFTPLLHTLEQQRIEPLPYERSTPGPEPRVDFLRAMGVAQACLPLSSSL